MDEMVERITLETHLQGRWQHAASVELASGGHGTASTLAYELDYVLCHDLSMTGSVLGNAALSVDIPLSMELKQARRWPSFLLDVLPQGHARKVLAATMGINADAAESESRLLLRAGGGPIGNVRVSEAWEAERSRVRSVPTGGMALDDVFGLDERFLELAKEFAAAASGSSGVQGAWPKMLMTQSTDGRWYPDSVVDDDEAVDHAIVKWIGDRQESTRLILASEAPYLELARAFGLRCARPLHHRGNVLLMPRFDRRVEDGKVVRIGQESIVSAAGIAAFAHEEAHETYLKVIKRVCSDPAEDIMEYVLRDVLNLATGNPDNHGRNTALAKDVDGNVRLTPLFDFCPMRLDPTGVRRSTTWSCMKPSGKPSRDLAPDWAEICEVAAEGVMPAADLKAALASKADILGRLPDIARDLGVDEQVIQRAMSRCGELAEALTGLEQ